MKKCEESDFFLSIANPATYSNIYHKLARFYFYFSPLVSFHLFGRRKIAFFDFRRESEMPIVSLKLPVNAF